MSVPRVSVIVPVRNRRDLLAHLLDALEAQTFDSYEVVVVDDGSTDGADEEVLRRAGRPVPIRLMRSNGLGAVAARRLGVSESSGEVLAFTDSDCVPAADWLEAGVRAIDAGADLVNGLTRPQGPVGPLERSMASATEGLYPTCNMFFRRSVYERMGGFDRAAADRLGFRVSERARGTGFGEDTMLAWDMIRAGAGCIHAPDAVVEHHVFPADPVDWLSRGLQMAAFPQLVKEVPELRNTLLRGGFYLGPRNRLPVYALAALLPLRRRRLALAALVLWVAATMRELHRMDLPLPKMVAWLVPEMALDLLVAYSLVIGSARSRSLVL